MRTCIGCRRRAEQTELIRVVRTPEGGLAVGRTLPGRGAWLCAGSGGCVEAAARQKAFARALRGPVAPEAVARLRAQLTGGFSEIHQPVREDGRSRQGGHDER